MWTLLAVQRWEKTFAQDHGGKEHISHPYPLDSMGWLPVFDDYVTALKASNYHPEWLLELSIKAKGEF